MRHAIIILVILIVPTTAHAATFKVPSQYPTIQDAIDVVQNGDTVLVAPGTYVENIDFKGKAITVMSEKGAGVTIIDGNQSGSVVTLVDSGGHDTMLEGFTITNGMNDQNACGGGIYCEDTAPTIINNVIIRNSVKGQSTGWGGGIYCYRSDARIIGNIIMENTATGNPLWAVDGGGIYLFQSTPIIANNIISKNSATKRGGGIFIIGPSEGAMLDNNTITENESENGGGINICLATVSCSNMIYWDNTAIAGPEIYLTGGIGPFFSKLTIGYSDVEGGQSSVFKGSLSVLDWGSGMLDADPLFFDTPNGDYHLKQDPCQPGIINPCVNSGSNPVYNLGMDMCSTKTNNDPDDGIVDMGFHYGPITYPVLKTNDFRISESNGGTILFTLVAGNNNKKRNYLILGGTSGTSPGMLLPGGFETLPLNWDAFTNLLILCLNSSLFSDFLGALDLAGNGSAQIDSGPLGSGCVGLQMHYAYCLNDPFDFVSNSVEIVIVP